VAPIWHGGFHPTRDGTRITDFHALVAACDGIRYVRRAVSKSFEDARGLRVAAHELDPLMARLGAPFDYMEQSRTGCRSGNESRDFFPPK